MRTGLPRWIELLFLWRVGKTVWQSGYAHTYQPAMARLG